MKYLDVINSPAIVSSGTFTRSYKSAAQFAAVRVALCVLGGIVLVLTLVDTANTQTPALLGDPSQGRQQARQQAVAQGGCLQNGKLDVADLVAMFDKGSVPSCVGDVSLSSAVAAGSTTDPAVIKFLAALAYVWGLGPEYIERFSTYNTILYAPFNELKYGAVPAAWNNEATNAGDASVIYISGFLHFDEVPEQVFTVPPSENPYYIIAYYDAYAQDVGSIGTRTTASSAPTSYLLVGPKSPYAKLKTARIHGYDYPVMASDTNASWILARVRANTLIDASDPTSVPNVANNVLHKFALNSLAQFEANGHQPVYPASFVLPPPTQQQIQEAMPYQNLPSQATDFLTQLGNLVATNPIPNQFTGLSGTPLAELPAWIVPQYGATTTYVVPSYGQKPIFNLFTPIGLTANGFQIPSGWGQTQLQALQDGYVEGQQALLEFINLASNRPSTNYWGIVNDPVGTYPSNLLGYLFRSVIVVEGGVANVGLDAVYPTLVGDPSPLDGNSTYKLTFTPPTSSPTLPAVGIYPPMVIDSSGNLKGFWSINLYAPDKDEGAAPFIAQTSVLNTSYSTADTAVVSVNAATNFMTVKAPNWGMLVQSTPILFGGDAIAFGLKPNTVYYVATPPITPNTGNTTYTFQISAQWFQTLSPDNVPIQNSGNPGPIVQLVSPAVGTLTWGMVKPVTQLGSSQLVAGQLVKNADGSLTLWFGPSLPNGVPASNWIPTPSTAYYTPLYGPQVSTAFQLTLRMYYPTPGNDPPSILPCTQACGPKRLPESYIPPVLELVP